MVIVRPRRHPQGMHCQQPVLLRPTLFGTPCLARLGIVRVLATSWNIPAKYILAREVPGTPLPRLASTLECDRGVHSLSHSNGKHFDESTDPPRSPHGPSRNRYTGVYWAGTVKANVCTAAWTAKIRRRAGRGEATIGSYPSEKVQQEHP